MLENIELSEKAKVFFHEFQWNAKQYDGIEWQMELLKTVTNNLKYRYLYKVSNYVDFIPNVKGIFYTRKKCILLSLR